MALIELDHVSKIYRVGSQEIVAVDDFSMQIGNGEFCVMAGPSGSGKTTLLNLIGCLDKPTQGDIYLNGQRTNDLGQKNLAAMRLREIGFVFQAYNLIPVLTAAENAEFTLMLQGMAPEKRREKVVRLFADLGLSGLENRKPADLSGGQQQRVAIARALASEPAVILADEPTASLDSRTSEELLELMEGLNKDKGATFIVSSHDPLVLTHASRVVRLVDGRLESEQ